MPWRFASRIWRSRSCHKSQKAGLANAAVGTRVAANAASRRSVSAARENAARSRAGPQRVLKLVGDSNRHAMPALCRARLPPPLTKGGLRGQKPRALHEPPSARYAYARAQAPAPRVKGGMRFVKHHAHTLGGTGVPACAELPNVFGLPEQAGRLLYVAQACSPVLSCRTYLACLSKRGGFCLRRHHGTSSACHGVSRPPPRLQRNAPQQHGHLGRVELYVPLVRGHAWQLERATLQAFVPDRKAVSVPPQHLQPVAACLRNKKRCPASRGC